MEYFSLIIPFIVSIFLLVFFKKKIVWWELALPALGSVITLILFKYTAKTIMVSDTEFRGSLITEARYYEPWETWKEETCTRQVACGTDSKGNTQYCTETYDCSYCDETAAQWYVYDTYGKKWSITQQYYNQLSKRWSSTPTFVELNRNINHHWGCGKDGDMYRVCWNNKIETSEPATWTKRYENKVQASHSSFKLPYISDNQAKIYGLYQYPDLYAQYKQKCVLGLDSLYNDWKEVLYVEQYFQYLNGYYGKNKHVKVFILMFYGKPISIVDKQQAYWDGGNRNELVVCIDVNKATKELNWVKAFTWCDNRRVCVDIREDIMERKYFDYLNVYNSITKAIKANFNPKDFEEFNYLTIDLSMWQIIWIYIITLIISVGVGIWAVKNKFTDE